MAELPGISNPWFWTQLAWAWPATHFFTYLCFLRKKQFMQSEKNIFWWHAGSWLLFFLLGAIQILVSMPDFKDPAAAVVLGLSLHGIYSLSFLELWSLTQASYSLQLLLAIGQKKQLNSVLRTGANLGRQKLEERKESLRQIGLITPKGRPSFPGRLVGMLCRWLAWVGGGKSLNF
jgi:hypothetical protein